MIRPGGSTRTILHGGDAERSPNGAIVAITGFFQDVTERTNAQRERQRLSEYVRLANQDGKIGIWELDLRTDVSVWDRNMFALYGINDITTVPTFELWSATLHPHDRARSAPGQDRYRGRRTLGFGVPDHPGKMERFITFARSRRLSVMRPAPRRE
jgi:PAS domain-containing protein